MPTKNSVNGGDGTLYYYDKYSDSWKPLLLGTVTFDDTTRTSTSNPSDIEKTIKLTQMTIAKNSISSKAKKGN